MAINSRNKSKNGELEFAKFLTYHGFKARWGQQFSGSLDSPDVVCESLPFHFEIKRTERFKPYDAIEQAKRDCSDKIPVVKAIIKHQNGVYRVYPFTTGYIKALFESAVLVRQEQNI